jgi:WhiB family redox-sensing transcriptional regulator
MYDFTTEANCIGIDVEMFFVEEDAKHYKEPELLKRICSNCTVKTECLDYALHHAVVGWWGGTSEKQRRAIREKRGISAEPVLITEKWIQ